MMDWLLYIDPGSGSYLVQAIIAAALGVGFWIKMSWHRLKDFFGRNKMKTEKDEDENVKE